MNLIIDGSNLAYRVWKGSAFLSSSKGKPVGVVYGVINSISSLLKTFKPQEVAIVWDGRPVFRKAVYPEYKGNRVRTEQEQYDYNDVYIPQLQELMKILPSLGVHQYRHYDAEADDVIATLVKHTGQYIIVTEDKDLLQLVSAYVSVYKPIRDRLVNEENFTESTQYDNPRQYLEARTLIGDTSDNILGIDGIGEKRAFALMQQYGTLKNMLQHKDELKKTKATARVADGEAVIGRNLVLMDLNMRGVAIGITDEQLIFIEGKLVENELKTQFIKYEFFSFLKKFQEFVSPFRQLK